MGALKFHERVKTPNGEGYVQGWLTRENGLGMEPYRVIVSLDPKTIVPEEIAMSYNLTPGIWCLAAYDPSEIKPIR